MFEFLCKNVCGWLTGILTTIVLIRNKSSYNCKGWYDYLIMALIITHKGKRACKECAFLLKIEVVRYLRRACMLKKRFKMLFKFGHV